jgi:fatty acid desaturase
MALSREKIKDAGLALVLILLIVALKFDSQQLIAIAAIATLLCMIIPRVFYPFAWFWYGLSHVLGPVMSRVILTTIYIIVVIPVGISRRLTGADPMLRKEWKQNKTSVFIDRDHTFGREDIEHPY